MIGFLELRYVLWVRSGQRPARLYKRFEGFREIRADHDRQLPGNTLQSRFFLRTESGRADNQRLCSIADIIQGCHRCCRSRKVYQHVALIGGRRTERFVLQISAVNIVLSGYILNVQHDTYSLCQLFG